MCQADGNLREQTCSSRVALSLGFFVREALMERVDILLNAYSTKPYAPEDREAEAAKTQRLRALRLAQEPVISAEAEESLVDLHAVIHDHSHQNDC
jgi:hypothetical protein